MIPLNMSSHSWARFT